MTAVIELNDLQVRVYDTQGQCTYDEPGAVSSANGDLVFGREALALSRANPQQFNYKYLHRFSADPLAGEIGPAKNHADLIYHQLKTLQLYQAVLCVPSHLNNQQLGLLLGICKQSGIEVRGFVDQGLAHSLNTSVDGNYQVLDLELHRGSIVQIDVSGEQREVTQAKSLESVGVSSIVDGWISVIADEFVQRTRFDPLHTGTAEQQLFNQVWSWLGEETLHNQHIEVSHSEHSRDIEVTAKLLQDKLAQRLRTIDLSERTLVLTRRAQSVPGLIAFLQQHGANVASASDSEFVDNCLALAAALPTGQIARINRGTSRTRPDTTASTPAETAPAATHLLNEHTAYALDDARFAGYFNDQSTPSLGSTVTYNGEQFTAIQVT